MKNLPELPNLQFLLREAKAIKANHRNGDESIVETIGHYDTSLHGLSAQQIFDQRFSILDAQRVVARQYGFSSWAKMKKFVIRSWKGKSPTDIRLQREVLVRYEKLRAMQQEAKNSKNQKLYEQYRHAAKESANLLNSAFDNHGWPGPEVVGPSGVQPMIYLSGNAVYDATFQHRAVELLEGTVSEGGAIARWYAQLLDRNLVLSNKPCVYGSAFGSYYNADGLCEPLVSEVEDPENVDKRRARVGLHSLKMEKSRCAKEAKENNWVLPTREQGLKRLKQLSLDGGYLQ